MCNNSGDPYLVFVEEPETRIRFRYESEGPSHGAMLGKRKEKRKKIYPTVKLENYDGKKRVHINVTLCTEDKEPHVFEFTGQSEGNVQCITEYLQEDNTVEFKNLKFLSKKKEETYRLLLDQEVNNLGLSRSERAQFEKKNSKELKEKARKIMNSVRLCFVAFEGRKRLCQPLYSDVIGNQKNASKSELKIHRMSRVSGSWKGDDEVILLCDRVEKDNIQVLFYESGDEEWQENAVFTPADVHYQVAITFRTPKYRVNAEKTVKVCLVRKGEIGEPLEFTYIPDFEGNPWKKRKMSSDQQSLVTKSENAENENIVSSPIPSFSGPTVGEPQPAADYMSNFLADNLDAFMSELNVDKCEEILDSEDYTLFNEVLIYSPDVMNVTTVENITEIDGGVVSRRKKSVAVQLDSLGHKVLHKYDLKKDLQKFPHMEGIQQKLYSCLMKRDHSGNTILHLRLYENKDITSILQVIKFTNADIINVKNHNQETAIHIAVKKNNEEQVKSLLINGSNPNLKNAEGDNCYHIAARDNYFDVLKCLVTHTRYKFELDAFNYEGLSPLHIAVLKNSEECYNHLLKLYEADINIVDKKSGRSLLHYAVEFHPAFIALLLEKSEIDVNIQDFEGNTPLHIACAKENIEAVKQLVAAGAETSLRNFKQNCNNLEESSEQNVDGQRPCDITTNSEILKLLAENNKASDLNKILEKLCSILDQGMKWKEVAIYVMDERFINSLECSPSPAKKLLQHIKKENEKNFIEYMKNLLEMTGLGEALDIIKETY